MKKIAALAAAPLLTTGAVLAAAPVHAADTSGFDVLLTAVDNSPGAADLTGAGALVLGPTGNPTPAPAVVAYYMQHYLHSVGNYTGEHAVGTPELGVYGGDVSNTFALTTPEQFTQLSYLQGDAAVVHQLLVMDAAGRFDEGNDPLYLLGYSQSSTILTAVDSHLNDQAWLEFVLTHGGYADDITTYANELAGLGGIAGDLRLTLLGDPAANPLHTSTPAGWDNNPLTQSLLNSESMGYGGGTIHDTVFPTAPGWFNPGTAVGGPASIGNPGPDGAYGTDDDVVTDGYGMAGQDTNFDLSPTSVYTVHGDNWAQVVMGWLGPNQTSLEHIIYSGMDASDFSLVDHVGNVDYYEATFNLWQELAALNSAMWLAFTAMF